MSDRSGKACEEGCIFAYDIHIDGEPLEGVLNSPKCKTDEAGDTKVVSIVGTFEMPMGTPGQAWFKKMFDWPPDPPLPKRRVIKRIRRWRKERRYERAWQYPPVSDGEINYHYDASRRLKGGPQ